MEGLYLDDVILVSKVNIISPSTLSSFKKVVWR